MRQFSREEIIERLRKRIEKQEPIVVCGAGTGLFAQTAENEKADLILANAKANALINGLSGEECMLPYQDVNEVCGELARHLLPVLSDTPVVAGIGPYNPYINADRLIRSTKSLGYSGVLNSPSSSGCSPDLKKNCFQSEVELIRKAKEENIFSMAAAKTPEEIEYMYEAGADVIVIRSDGEVEDLDRYIDCQRQLAAIVHQLSGDIILLADIGRITDTEAIQRLLTETKASGIVSEEAVGSLAVQKEMGKTLKEIINH